ncbi:MAG: sugar transferase [Ignavibacteria bacterium]|nr:sugar transferase [Ignavibacteria bacterium]
MSELKEKLFLFISDFITINTAWTVYYIVRIQSGLFPYTIEASFVIPLVVMYFYWLIVFSVSGLYQYWFARSRFDEFSSVFKSVSVGCLILFFLIFIDDSFSNTKTGYRFVILIYWIFMILFVSSGRLIIRSFQRKMLEKGIGQKKSIIIGTGERAKELNRMINKFPQLGYKVIGFVSVNGDKKESFGGITELKSIIENNEITEVLIALEKDEKEMFFEVLRQCSGDRVNLKILPDTYEIVSGMARTNQLYGVPLIEVMPEIMPYPSRIMKRILDIFISAFMLIVLLPVLIVFAVLIKITSKGQIVYKQIRVGKNNKKFVMYKLRTMIENAEEYGPEWAGEKDPRITPVGRIIRKFYLDETLQFINVLKNEMSIVGPRPERPEFVEVLMKEFPYYYKRLSVKPGITGWAQIKHKYDSSLDDVREKLKYDFYYIENMSLRLDLKIMINTIIVILLMKGH